MRVTGTFKARHCVPGETESQPVHVSPDDFFAMFIPDVQLRDFLTVGWSGGPTGSSERSHSKHSSAAGVHPRRRI